MDLPVVKLKHLKTVVNNLNESEFNACKDLADLLLDDIANRAGVMHDDNKDIEHALWNKISEWRLLLNAMDIKFFAHPKFKKANGLK